jgi:phospholipid/cholesterol/gamma-HCH transport system substrate-binding protein
MPKPFKFRYVNEIAGAFVLLTVALLVAAILLAGHAQEWFTPVRRIHVDFPLEGSLGIQKGAEVQILGYTVGKVERVTVEEDGRMTGFITVKGDFIRFVRIDSRAVVKRMFGVAGAAYIEITEGQGELLPEDFNLECVKDQELLEMAEQMVNQIKDAVVPALEQVQKAVVEYTALAADLRSTNGPLVGLLVNLEEITRGLKQGEGTAGQLLRDPALADEITGILQKVNAALTDVKKILRDVEATTAQLPPMADKIGGEVDDMPGLVDQTQETIREAERLIEGIQKHWLLRSNIPQPAPTKLIAPAEVIRP